MSNLTIFEAMIHLYPMMCLPASSCNLHVRHNNQSSLIVPLLTSVLKHTIHSLAETFKSPQQEHW